MMIYSNVFVMPIHRPKIIISLINHWIIGGCNAEIIMWEFFNVSSKNKILYLQRLLKTTIYFVRLKWLWIFLIINKNCYRIIYESMACSIMPLISFATLFIVAVCTVKSITVVHVKYYNSRFTDCAIKLY